MSKQKNKLICKWDKKIKTINYIFPNPKHGKVLHRFFRTTIGGKNLIEALEDEGYDITTLKFEIELENKE